MSHLLPITRRGLFGEDDFFASFRPSYSSAVEDVMDRWGGRSLLADRFSNYRSGNYLLRKINNQLQVWKLFINKKKHKNQLKVFVRTTTPTTGLPIIC